MAKTANNKKGGTGRSSSTGKAAQGKKAVAKRTDGKPARGRTAQKPQAAKAKTGRAAEKQGFMKFLRDVRVEMGKVTWPTRKDLAQSTLVVLVAVGIAAAFTWGVDTIFVEIVDAVVNLLT